jgi:lipoate-protein ligase A
LFTTRISSITPVPAKSIMAPRMESRSLYVGKTTEMRLPRHDTPLSLPAEQPREALVRDEALLEQVHDDGEPLVRWWVAATPAVVVGLGLSQRLASVVDLERCRAAGIGVLQRKAGGGALLLDAHMLCGAICLPTSAVSADLTESYRWLGDRLTTSLRGAGVTGARRVEVDEARADVAYLRQRDDSVARLLLSTCYGALSPHEVVIGNGSSKLVGLAQVRRRHAALFQFGLLLRDQSPLADYLLVNDEPTREQLKIALRSRTVGLETLTSRSAVEVAAAIADATPSAP